MEMPTFMLKDSFPGGLKPALLQRRSISFVDFYHIIDMDGVDGIQVEGNINTTEGVFPPEFLTGGQPPSVCH